MPQEKKQPPIRLGDHVKDTITGFHGVVVAVTLWLNGCRRMTVQPRDLTEKGSMPMSESFDEGQLVVLERGAVPGPNSEPEPGDPVADAPRDPLDDPNSTTSPPREKPRRTGGPRPEPTRQADPRPV